MSNSTKREDFRNELLSTKSGRLMLEAIDRLPDGVSIFDEDFTPLYANKTSMERFSATHDRLSNGESFREANRHAVVEAMPHFTAEQVDQATDEILAHALEGRPLYVKTQGGSIVKTVYEELSEGQRAAISVDITELKHREKELIKARQREEAANAAKSVFLSNMSHEIRTPLNAVVGLAEILKGYDLPEEVYRHVCAIHEAGDNLTLLLNDVLDTAKIESGKLELAPVATDLLTFIDSTKQLWFPRIRNKGLKFITMVDTNLPPVLVFDPLRVRQCLSNLISNAIKFTDSGGITVMIRGEPLSRDRLQLVISVTDTGTGIDPKVAAKLFQPFTQADAKVAQEHGGTGLGLNITRELAHLMGGEIVLESSPGEGSTFVVTLEVGVADEQRTRPRQDIQQTAEPVGELKGKHILIVDDIPINREVARLLLTRLGCRCVEVSSGLDALIALEQERFDAVLLDGQMPIMDGPETISRIRASDKDYRDVAVISMTADVMAGDREWYLSLGMDGYLPKPIGEHSLKRELLRVLKEKAGGGDHTAKTAAA